MRYFLISLLAFITVGGLAKADKGLDVTWKHITPKMLHGRIAYIQGNKLKCMNPDGTGKQTILSDAEGMQDIQFSPDLTHIVYSYDRPKDDPYLGTELFSMTIDGSDKHQLTHNEYKNDFRHPRYSPDGRKIVYARWSGKHWGGPMTATADLWIMNANGSDNHRLIGDYLKWDKAYTYSKPSWSNDGTRIFCERTKGGFPESPDARAEKSEPTSVKLDGTEVPLPPDYESKYHLDNVSSDGKKAIKVTKSGEHLVDAVLEIVDNSTGSIKKLATLSNSDILKKLFALDERYIVFSQLLWGHPQTTRIWRVKIDGSGLEQLVEGKTDFVYLVQSL